MTRARPLPGVAPYLAVLLCCGTVALGCARTGLHAVFATNHCGGPGEACQSKPIRELGSLVVTPLDRHGVADPTRSTTREVDGGGEVFARLEPGRYRLRSSRQPTFGFDATVVAGQVTALDCRSRAGAGHLVGHVTVAVGGGAEGNPTVSGGGPGSFLVVSIVPLVAEDRLDRTRAVFAMTDAHGSFEVRLPPGRYWVSDVSEANQVGRPGFEPNQTPIRGGAVEVPSAAPVHVELVAVAAAP